MPNGPNDPPSQPPPSSTWDRLAELPDLDEAPLDAPWARPHRSPVPSPPLERAAPADTAPRTPAPQPTRQAPVPSPRPTPGPDPRQFHVRPGPPGAVAPLPSPVISPPDGPGGFDDGSDRFDDGLPPRRARRSRRPWVAAALLIPLMALAGFALYSWYLWTQVEKVDTDDALSSGGGGFTNYLIVGVDSRDGVDRSLETAANIGLGVAGSRSDTMVLLHVGPNGNKLVSLPRDLWVDIVGYSPAKLNAATTLGGPPTLIRTVEAALGIPVHHYLEVDLAGFLSVVDAVGSITLDFDAPACDPKSGLDVRQRGPVSLDAEQALAYVRSRTYTEFDADAGAGLDCNGIRNAGIGRTVGNADFGRSERQRTFLLAVFDEVSSTRNPVTAVRVMSGLSEGLRVDDEMNMWEAFGLLRDLRGLDAETTALPVADFSAPDGSAALVMTNEAQPLLDSLR